MRKSLTTVLLLMLALLSVTAAVFLAYDGNLARLTGWYHFRPGMPLFPGLNTDNPEENLKRINEVSWMRIQDLHDMVECRREADGTWWIEQPFRDRMSPTAVQKILAFTVGARLVDTLPLNHTTRASLREFGVESVPHTITLKVPAGKGGEMTTVARYTLGSASPWLADARDGSSVLPTTYLRTDYFGHDKRIHVVSGCILDLFKNGLQSLRDPHPLNINLDSLRSLIITPREGSVVKLTRMSAETPWVLTSPVLCEADPTFAESLMYNLARLRAVRIDSASDVELPETPKYTIELHTEEGEPLQLRLYEPFVSPVDSQMLCYATVNNRPVVFTLPAESRLHRKNSYTELVNAILELPVLPAQTQARIRAENDVTYVNNLRLTAADLRSQRLTSLNPADISRVLIRSRFYPYPVSLVRIPGDSEGQVPDTWMCSASGKQFTEADNEVVSKFLVGLSSVPVLGFEYDFAPGESISAGMKKYDLQSPDYTLMLQPTECTLRATLFGQDMPLVKDRQLRTFYLKRHGKGRNAYWVGMEMDTPFIYRISPKMTSLFTFTHESWKKRNLVQFPMSALRTLTLYYQQATLVMNYDYVGAEWNGTLNGEDISLRINPNRTDYYLRHLQNLRVQQWLPVEDEDAQEALQQVVFSIKLDLELPDYTDVEEIVMQQGNDDDVLRSGGSRRDQVEQMLTEDEESQRDKDFRLIAMADVKKIHRSVTIDIAPADMRSSRPIFYGRIRETGDLFILSFEDAQSMGGSLLD